MREIKFRAWDKVNNDMTLNDSFYEVQKWNRTEEELKDFELMQYTGLKDKNGVEIYEGDIVKLYNKNYCGLGKCESIAKITYNECEFVAEPISEGEVKDKLDMTYEMQFYGYEGREFRWEDLEVIGNIYQNPELLK